MHRTNIVKRESKQTAVKLFLLGVLSAVVLGWGESAWAQANPVRIMPLGDSITSSIDGQASYRYWLWNRLQNAGFNFTFVGTMWGVGDGASGTYPNFDQSHEGHPGATTQDILDGISGWAAQDQPDVVLLLIGVNDFQEGITPGRALLNTRQIINALRAQNPQVVILWGMLPPVPGEIPQERIYNMGMLSLALRWSTPQSPIRVVNLMTGYIPAVDTVDGQHPNAAGEKIIANRFFAALVPVLARFR